MLRRPEHGRLNCPELTTWIAKPGQRCRLECDGGYTPSVSQITCFEHGWSIPKMVASGGSAPVSCVGGGATTMLIIGLIVGGLILIFIIAFAYAKFNQPSGNESVDGSVDGRKVRGANARKAMDEETVIKNEEFKKKFRAQNYENPSNIYMPEPTMMNQHMDNNSIYARGNSPDSYASGYPPLVLQGMPPAYDFRPQMSPQSHIQNYETFMPAHMMGQMDPMASMVSMQGPPMNYGFMNNMNMNQQPIGPSGLPPRSVSYSHSMSAYDHVTLPAFNRGNSGLGPKSKSFSPEGYNVNI